MKDAVRQARRSLPGDGFVSGLDVYGDALLERIAICQSRFLGL
ncbi:hypothetical protein [Rhizobium sp. NXC24]|nr:hypothetical protein [Rhizobium sp. NXC24]